MAADSVGFYPQIVDLICGSSILPGHPNFRWGSSSVGRAAVSQAAGRGFDFLLSPPSLGS